MELTCPVCGEAVPSGEPHCVKCGFPRALATRLRTPVTFTPAPEPERSPELPPVPRARAATEEVRPEAQLNASIARALEERMTILQTLDPGAPNVTGEMCEAALNEAGGRLADAQQILRSAQARLDKETEELLARHLNTLESRGKTLEAEGLHLALEDRLARLAESVLANEAATSVKEIAAEERRLTRLEAHWRDVEQLFGQITTLVEEGRRLGVPVGEIPDRLAAIRQGLAALPAEDRDLDQAAQAASGLLMELHKAIPTSLEQELERHGAAIGQHPEDRPKARSAKRLHAEAARHLADGRLLDAVESVRELRQVLAELTAEAAAASAAAIVEPTAGASSEGAVPAPAVSGGDGVAPPAVAAELEPPPPTPVVTPAPSIAPPNVAAVVPSAPVPPPEEAPAPVDQELASLMQKARDLAARIRALPSGSPEAKVATRHLHSATKLLRERRLAEAAEFLAQEPPGAVEPVPSEAPSPRRPGPPAAARSAPVPAETAGPAKPAEAVVASITAGDADELAALTQKARGLAAWVRTLPPDSAEAMAASREILDAAQLLEAHHLAEADEALTRLMRSLAQPPHK